MSAKIDTDKKFVATLALAKAIVEHNEFDAQIAIKAGANPRAYWLDGTTKLDELAVSRGVSIEHNLKVKRTNKDSFVWDINSLTFAVRRGYQFAGVTNPVSSVKPGSPIKQIRSAKSALKLLVGNQDLIERVSGRGADRDEKKCTFTADIGARWNGDRRIVGFTLTFQVDAKNDDLMESFLAAKKSGRQNDDPDPTEAVLNAQKDWEGNILSEEFSHLRSPTLDDAIKVLRRGGNPFYKDEDWTFGDSCSDEDAKCIEVLRTALGSEPGWHLRIGEHLTHTGLEAIKAKTHTLSAKKQTKK